MFIFILEISFNELGTWDKCEGKDAGANYTYVSRYEFDSDCVSGYVSGGWDIIQCINGQTSVNAVTLLTSAAFPMSSQYF